MFAFKLKINVAAKYTARPGNSRLLHLQLVLIVDLFFVGSELLGQLEGLDDMLGGHKVIDDLNTAVKVLDLEHRQENMEVRSSQELMEQMELRLCEG